MRKPIISSLILLTALLLFLAALSGCGGQGSGSEKSSSAEEYAQSSEAGANKDSRYPELAGKKIGILIGSIFDTMLEENIPDCEILFYNSYADLAMALSQGKIDGYMTDDTIARLLLQQYPQHGIYAELAEDQFGYIFTKGSEKSDRLLAEMNEFLAKIRANGTIEKIDAVWFGSDESKKVVDMSGLTGKNGTVIFACASNFGEPMCYMKDGQYAGYDVDIAVRFCREYGYNIEIADSDFSGILAAVASGKADFGASGISITDERKKVMNFSDPNYYGGSVLVMRETENQSIIDKNDLGKLMAGKRVGMITGAAFDEAAEMYIPDAYLEYINNNADVALALEYGRIDAYLAEEAIARIIFKTYNEQYIVSSLETLNYGFGFNKNSAKSDALRAQINEFIKKLRDDGTLNQIEYLWFDADESVKIVDMSGLTGENGKLTFAVSTDVGAPFSYIKDGQYCGYDLDIAVRFCREYGYDIEINDYSFSGLLTCIAGGRCDFGGSGICQTEERAESMSFSIPNFTGDIVLVTKDNKDTNISAISDAEKLKQLNYANIGIVTGSSFNTIATELMPDCRVFSLDSNIELALALEVGKINGYLTDQPVARLLLNDYPTQTISAVISKDDYGFIFSKSSEDSEALRQQLNSYLAKIRADGTLQALDGIWFGDDESKKTIDLSSLKNVNGELTLAVSTAVGAPFCYLKDEKIVGYEVDITVHFCREYGYSLKLVNLSFSDMLPMTAAGKFDFAASGISITDERKDFVNFSDPTYTSGIVLVTKKSEEVEIGHITGTAEYEKYKGASVGILAGSYHSALAKKLIPACEVTTFASISGMSEALEQRAIDAFIADDSYTASLLDPYSDRKIGAVMDKFNYAFIFTKEDPEAEVLCAKMNIFLSNLRSTGELDKIIDIWDGEDESKQIVDMGGLTGNNGTLRLAVYTGVGKPFMYLKNGAYAGFEADIAVRFCREYGYGIEFVDSDFSGMLESVENGSCDFGVSCITVTEEREKILLFSDPDYRGTTVLITVTDLKKESNFISDFLNDLKDRFEKTFITEKRYVQFVKGIGVTLLITLVSAICGTFIAFILFLLYRQNIRGVNLIFDFLSDVLLKTPVVMILMILYYLVFVHSLLDGIWVSCIGFSMIFAASVLGNLKVSTGSVDSGQMEAALALGYRDTRAFLRVILPQALRHFLPIYQSDLVNLIKSTAIVGYIAVQDLTKVSDIIRSRTYEAFFPLIASAVIYFLIAWILTLLVKSIQIGTDPKRRSTGKVLKGIETK